MDLVHSKVSREDVPAGSDGGGVLFLLQVYNFIFICVVLAVRSSLVDCIMPRLKLFNLYQLGGDLLLWKCLIFFPSEICFHFNAVMRPYFYLLCS